MKAFIITNFYEPLARGGSEEVARRTVEGFEQEGFAVVVATAAPWRGFRSLLPIRTEEGGVRVYRFFPLNFYFAHNAQSWPRAVQYVWTLFDILNIHSALITWYVCRLEKPDIIISHNLRGYGYLVPRICALHTKRYVHVVHDVQLAEPSGLLYPDTAERVLRQWQNRAYQVLTRWLFGSVPYVVSPSSFIFDFYWKLGFFARAKQALISNPVEVFSPASSNNSRNNFLYVGGIEEHKGIRDLLEAWKLAAVPGAVLNVVGSGSIYDELVAEHVPGVIFHGYQTGSALNKLWEKADVFVFPSRCVENAPLVVSEARSRGLHIIATSVGGVPELLAGYRNAIIVAPQSNAELVAALQSRFLEVPDRETVDSLLQLSARAYARRLCQLTEITT